MFTCVKIPQFQITFPYGCIVWTASNCLLMEIGGSFISLEAKGLAWRGEEAKFPKHLQQQDLHKGTVHAFSVSGDSWQLVNAMHDKGDGLHLIFWWLIIIRANSGSKWLISHATQSSIAGWVSKKTKKQSKISLEVWWIQFDHVNYLFHHVEGPWFTNMVQSYEITGFNRYYKLYKYKKSLFIIFEIY
jgi:hypothetical protein